MTRRYTFSPDVLAANPGLDAPTRRVASARHQDEADTLAAHLRTLAPDIPPPERDRPFATFRIDLAWPDVLVAVEVNGGQWAAGGGKHGSRRDHQKMRELAIAGWRVLVFTATEVRDDPLGCIDDIRRMLAYKGDDHATTS